MSKRKAWLIAAGCLFVGVAIAAILLLRWMQNASVGTVHTGVTANNTLADAQPITIKTGYFTTTLPAGFTVRRHTETPGANILVQLVATTPSTTDQQFAVTLGTVPAGGLREVGDYNLRSTNTEAYAPFSFASLPEGATGFRNTAGPAAFVVFWPYQSRYVEIALTSEGVATLQQLETTFSGAISAWHWL
jgi:hypothetical protein